MAGTVTPNLTTISLCEALTGWTAVGGTNTLNDPTVFDARQGSYCIQNYSAAVANRGADYDFGVDTDLSDTTIYFWFAFSKVPHATNYMRIRVTDAAGNWREWNIFNKASLPHLSWIAWALKTTVAYDAQSATPPTMTAIRKVGWRMDSVIGKVYIYFDAWRYGTGLTITGGTSADPATLEDLYLADTDTANAYGVIDKYNNVYFLQGKITIGSLTPDVSTYFKDTNQVVQFKSIKGEPSGFYEIKGQNATSGAGTTKIFFGEKSGTAGISGLFIRAPSAMKWKLTMSDTYITEFGFYGCTFVYADTITGQTYSPSKEFLSTNFLMCAEMLPNTGIVKYCKFISSPAEAVRMIDTAAEPYLSNCDFITCSRAVHIPNIGTYSFKSMNFFSNTYDVKNSSAGLVTVNYDQYCSPAPSTHEETGGGTTVIQTSVTLTVRHVKTGNEPTEYVRCAIYKKSDMSEIMNIDATVADDQNPGYYKASQTYTATGIAVVVRAREKGYLPFETEATITSNGLDVTAIWIPDPNYAP
jgi:hypothetical protein